RSYSRRTSLLRQQQAIRIKLHATPYRPVATRLELAACGFNLAASSLQLKPKVWSHELYQ
ncbi:hypothetical protein, partial [Pseudomonas syringae group genomosp. 7]|uniref:hypothetical protein n=1 Tax=Pseudomonas syringae group genomosp. 7 TaxID=251699 RepID=UPI00376FBEB2